MNHTMYNGVQTLTHTCIETMVYTVCMNIQSLKFTSLYLHVYMYMHVCSNYASVRMRSEAYGSHFVCVCVCLFRAHLLFPWTLGTGKCFYGYYTVFSKYMQFADLQDKALFLRYGNICLPRRLL